MSDSLEHLLDNLGPGERPRASEPPAAFLRAVTRRRRQRRARQLGATAAVLLAAGGSWFLVQGLGRNAPGVPERRIASVNPASAIALVMANRDRAPSELRLYAPPDPEPEESLSPRTDPERVAEWFTQ